MTGPKNIGASCVLPQTIDKFLNTVTVAYKDERLNVLSIPSTVLLDLLLSICSAETADVAYLFVRVQHTRTMTADNVHCLQKVVARSNSVTQM